MLEISQVELYTVDRKIRSLLLDSVVAVIVNIRSMGSGESTTSLSTQYRSVPPFLSLTNLHISSGIVGKSNGRIQVHVVRILL